MTELEYVEHLRDRVAERMCDTENWHGNWAHLMTLEDQAALNVRRWWVRQADAALSLLAPMLAERDARLLAVGPSGDGGS